MTDDIYKQRYEYIAHQINREDGLVNFRLTWTLQLNGFLFAALALVAEKVEPSIRQFFFLGLPLIGLGVSLSGFAGVFAANLQLRYLTQLWYQNGDFRWPRPFGAKYAFSLGTLPSYLPVLLLSSVWLFLLIKNFNAVGLSVLASTLICPFGE